EVDLIKMIDDVFTELFQGKLNYTVSINNRKILQGIVESIGEPYKLEQVVVAIDKFDKIGFQQVFEEIKNLDIEESKAWDVMKFLECKNALDSKIIQTKDPISSSLEMLKEFLGKFIGNPV